jgi:hypothetical protein
MLVAGVGVAAGLTTAACGSDPKVTWAEAGSTAPGSNNPKAAPTSTVRVTVTPAADAKDIAPGTPVTITAESGTLQTVTVLAGEKAVAGTLDSDQRTWRSTGALEYSKIYTVTASAVDPSGLPAQHTSTFETIKPTGTATVTFQANALVALKTGNTYGVGQPVIVRFSKAIKDRATTQQAMEVTAEPSVQGRWHWIDNQTAHWRPKEYWRSGTKITVKVNVLGVNLGNGVYGAKNASTNFSIGPSRIAIADNSTHRMQVFVNGAMVRDIPVSLGKGGTTTTTDGKTIHYWTHNGPHIVLTKESSVHMTSASYGITDPKNPNFYDETIKLCARISYSGGAAPRRLEHSAARQGERLARLHQRRAGARPVVLRQLPDRRRRRGQERPEGARVHQRPRRLGHPVGAVVS